MLFLVIQGKTKIDTQEQGSINVSLTAELEKYIADKVASGYYNSASEVIREGLRLLKDHDALKQIHLNELRVDVQAGIDSGEPQSFDVEDFIERGRQRYTQQTKAN